MPSPLETFCRAAEFTKPADGSFDIEYARGHINSVLRHIAHLIRHASGRQIRVTLRNEHLLETSDLKIADRKEDDIVNHLMVDKVDKVYVNIFSIRAVSSDDGKKIEIYVTDIATGNKSIAESEPWATLSAKQPQLTTEQELGLYQCAGVMIEPFLPPAAAAQATPT